MQMSQLLPGGAVSSAEDFLFVSEICKIIRSIAKDSKDRKYMQKIAGDIQAIEKISLLFLNTKDTASNTNEDVEMIMDYQKEVNYPSNVQEVLLKTLAALTSTEETCRKKLAENKKLLEELLKLMKSNTRDVKLAACKLFLSLSRSDKILKSLILEAGEFTKELQKILISSDDDPKL